MQRRVYEVGLACGRTLLASVFANSSKYDHATKHFCNLQRSRGGRRLVVLTVQPSVVELAKARRAGARCTKDLTHQDS